MQKFSPASPADVPYLRSLAHDSEAHWGDSPEFMDKFDQDFNITASFLEENPVFAAYSGQILDAFWGMRQSGQGWELEYFYVAEPLLGKGYGKNLWLHLTDWCRSHQIASFQFVTSHQAIGFYEKMGAVQDRMAVSSIDGREIPHFYYEIPADGRHAR